jgi:hypothetical protein
LISLLQGRSKGFKGVIWEFVTQIEEAGANICSPFLTFLPEKIQINLTPWRSALL